MEVKNSMRQCFVYGSDCMALNVKPTPQYCGTCKFFKTEKQFEIGAREAKENLERRGLRAASAVNANGDKTVTVVPDLD